MSEYMYIQPRQRAVLHLAWPMILSNITVPLLGIVDTAILGHLANAEYLAAVATGSNIVSFMLWGFSFLRMGTTGLTSQALGREDYSHHIGLLYKSTVLAIALGVILNATQFIIIPLAINWIKPSPNVAELALSYCQIRILSAPATLANYAIIGWFIGIQNTRYPLLITLIINTANILLDWCLVILLDWKSDGAAIATVIADYLGLALGVLLIQVQLRRYKKISFRENLFKFSDYFEIITVNRRLFIRTACLLFTFAFFTSQGARIGDSTLAANTILMQLLLLTSYGLDGFAHAAEALVGRATGAKQKDDFFSVCRSVTYWSLAVAILFTLFFISAKASLVAGFSDIHRVRENVLHYYGWICGLPLLSVWSYLLDGIFIGAQKTAEMQNTILLACFGIFIPVWWATQTWGNHGLWFSFCCFSLARSLSLGLLFIRNTRQQTWF
jgi:multidrug resistance protein, MATE family